MHQFQSSLQHLTKPSPRIVERESCNPRYDKDGNIKSRNIFYSYHIDPVCFEQNINAFTSRFPSSTYTSHGIDKMDFTIHRNYVDEEQSIINLLKNGSLTLRKHGAYLHISIHREYLDLEKNILHQVERVLWDLMMMGVFKLPLRKTTISLSGEVLEEKSFSYQRQIFSLYDYFTTIRSKINSVSSMEIFFDFKESLSGLLDVSQFNTFKTTLYSKDYKYYQGNGSKRQSLLCIYKKAEQLRDVKNVKSCDIDTRVEFRLQKQNFQRLLNSLDILDGNFEELLTKLKKPLIKRLNKLSIDFRKLINYLNNSNSLKDILVETECLCWTDSKKGNKDECVPSEDHNIRNFRFSFLSELLIKIFYCVIKTLSFKKENPRSTISTQVRGP